MILSSEHSSFHLIMTTFKKAAIICLFVQLFQVIASHDDGTTDHAENEPFFCIYQQNLLEIRGNNNNLTYTCQEVPAENYNNHVKLRVELSPTKRFSDVFQRTGLVKNVLEKFFPLHIKPTANDPYTCEAVNHNVAKITSIHDKMAIKCTEQHVGNPLECKIILEVEFNVKDVFADLADQIYYVSKYSLEFSRMFFKKTNVVDAVKLPLRAEKYYCFVLVGIINATPELFGNLTMQCDEKVRSNGNNLISWNATFPTNKTSDYAALYGIQHTLSAIRKHVPCNTQLEMPDRFNCSFFNNLLENSVPPAYFRFVCQEQIKEDGRVVLQTEVSYRIADAVRPELMMITSKFSKFPISDYFYFGKTLSNMITTEAKSRVRKRSKYFNCTEEQGNMVFHFP